MNGPQRPASYKKTEVTPVHFDGRKIIRGGKRMYFYDRGLTGTPSETVGITPVDAVGLGIAVLQLIAPKVWDGGFKTTSTPADFMHPNTPKDIPWRSAEVEFEIKASRPNTNLASIAFLAPKVESFWFRLSFRYNGHDLRDVQIVPLKDRSSAMHSSTFDITFFPVIHGSNTDPVAKIKFLISGEWNPVGYGDYSFWSSSNVDGLLVKATGEVSRPNIGSELNTVQAGAFNRLSDSGSPLSRLVETFLDVFFPQPGSDRVKPGTEEEIVAWYKRLPRNIREQIETGSTPVQIYGYASRTGSVTINRELSNKRAVRVMQILRDFAGPNAQLEIFARGEFEAVTPDKVESPQDRRVRITVTHHAPGGSRSILAGRKRNVIDSAMRVGDESAVLQMAMNQGIRDVNRLTNLLFFAKHPERKGRNLSRREQDFSRLSEEWVNIRDRLVLPALARTRPTLR